MGGDKTEKTTIMVLKVDLQCSCCYKKVKKVLCKFPQIRDQVYDEKANTVTITVVCCDPERFRDKLCSKGCGVIKSIEIKDPPKPKAPEKPKQPEPEKPKQPEKPTVVIIEKPKEPEKPKQPEKPTVVIIEKPKEPEKPKVPEKPKPKEPEKTKECPKPNPVAPPSQPPPPPRGYCCGQCYEGHIGGPCYQWYGRPVPPAPPGYCCGQCSEGHIGGPCYEWYGRPVPCYDNYGPGPYVYGRGFYVSRCDQYLSEENATGCSIM
ncbi:protein PYRICULARIA ORYZAE RESISTANCE 21 [Nicotiana tomentosiformis]|uniref:protein PYRICULARIA ORYZAE RESISTANCE 21 n=1 Tax=Nicotiana tomentosiformis TaxID=4098 RepID=UPI00051C86FF|nr:protein PYRICULARIA ORYZAE RESISTANCE 21-like [Nicotiana tomentosiformis]